MDDIDDDYSGWNIYGEKRSSPKKGRRAEQEGSNSESGNNSIEFLDSPFKGLNIKGFMGESAAAPPKPPRTSSSSNAAWADNSTKMYKRDDSAEYAKVSNQFDADETADNMPSIPDLDDFQEEDFINQVAKAPNVSVNRVATYKELDNDLHRHAAFVTLNDIDLKALTRFMALESDVKEDDSPWSWDILMSDISSKFNMESLNNDDEN